jgi:hypothetical protein
LCQIAPGFGSSARRDEGYISGYVAFNATQQMGQRPSKMVQLFFSAALRLRATHTVVLYYFLLDARCAD